MGRVLNAGTCEADAPAHRPSAAEPSCACPTPRRTATRPPEAPSSTPPQPTPPREELAHALVALIVHIHNVLHLSSQIRLIPAHATHAKPPRAGALNNEPSIVELCEALKDCLAAHRGEGTLVILGRENNANPA
eukprot:CAMPEP_0173396354 /NCGR_PEP_ID=MMETSP1356-20130122/35201_1 /TAXON_ID=77927 ORGANISM="Hemiselmis virescens, Strain PCC157" /NCGR_SAMPLE_ID=MMETSP1356 /ASSEMBLY_ACC=CAM_ASM_000847 /LENGTH=133 /DNA_ID=CAMNT_0014355359 /DNA_START=265 /DNA_END=663 /DNA_ORIENTATION=+